MTKSTTWFLAALLFTNAPTFAKTSKTGSLDELKMVEGDEEGNEVKVLKAELLVGKAEQNAILQAQRLVKQYAGTPLEPEIRFRLAEMYMRRSKTDRFFEVHRESETVVKLAPRLVKEASSKLSVQNAIAAYADIQKRFPEFSQMDLVIFNHAFANQSLGQENEADALYQKLIAAHASSPLVPDAHLAIGEIAFTRSQFKVALDHFNAIRKYPESRVYPYGLYKAAWTHYNMRDAERALKKLEEVVAFGRFVTETHVDARLDLRKEALNDMTLFYEDVYPAKDAYVYFKAQAGPDDVGPLVLRMANLYERHARFNDQRVALTKFTENLPKSPLLPKVNTDLVLAYDHLKLMDQAVDQLKVLSELCKADGRWAKAQPKTAVAAQPECVASLNETSLRMAKKWLRAWKKLPGDVTYANVSERAFEVYLNTPAAAPIEVAAGAAADATAKADVKDTTPADRAEARFAYADLLFARQKFRAASAQYALIGTPKGKLGHDAAYGAVVSLEKAVGETWSADDERTFHGLAKTYVDANPEGLYRLDVEYKMALLAYEKNRYDEAAPIFVRLGRQFGDQDKGVKAQDLNLDILNLRKDYHAIREYAQELLKAKPVAARELKVRHLYEQAYFLEIQGLEEQGKLPEALAGYQAFAAQNGAGEFTEKAVYNTFQLQFKLNDVLGAAKTAEDYAGRFPQSPRALDALMRAAQTFEQMAQLSEAARVLEKLAARDPAGAPRWRELAADFHALDGEAPAARRLYQDLAANADAATKTKLLIKREALERNYGTPAAHAEIVKLMVDQNLQPYAARARVAQVEATLKDGRDADAFNDARRLLGTDVPAAEKARLRLVQAKVLEAEFTKASVKTRAERVGQVLAIKTEKLQKAQEAFQSVIRYGNPRTSMDALEHLYGLYSSYVTALKTMPNPAGLSDADAAAFRKELDSLMMPLEEKSADALTQAVQFARKQDVLDGTADRLARDLAALNKQSVRDLAPSLQTPAVVVPLLAGELK